MDKPSPEKALAMLRSGNERFRTGGSMHPNLAEARMKLAAASDQADYAYATVVSCSDSRVPVELLFDAGIMELFVVRVAGNVCGPDELGSIEYGVSRVKTPILVVLGHAQCGAVTVATQVVRGQSGQFERNTPSVIDKIRPAVEMAASRRPDLDVEGLIPHAIEENVWQSIWTIFTQSPIVRQLVQSGTLVVRGAIYDLSTGRVDWLPHANVSFLLTEAEASPESEKETYVTV